jgi:hypothetical protein
MSYNRYARRADTTTGAIVEELRNRGYKVYHIGRPTDLLVRHPSWPLNTFKLLECKSPKGGRLKLRSDQEAQQAFCAEHGVPYAMSGLEALHAMGETVSI